VPLDARRTLVHLSYGYRYGTLSKWAMQTYLATSGSAKVGFSTERDADGEHLVHGMRGGLERNTMRYFLAIEAFLETQGASAEKRAGAWFDASERYPKQLHEMTRREYLDYKPQDFAAPRSRVAGR